MDAFQRRDIAASGLVSPMRARHASIQWPRAVPPVYPCVEWGDAMSNDNKELVRRLFEEGFNARATDVFDVLITTDYVEHATEPFRNAEPGKVEGPKHMRSVVDWLVEQFPDITMTVEAIVTDGDAVVARVLSEGTNRGKLGGVIPPTGKRFSARQSHWYRVEDGKLAEHWAIRDDLTAMMQMGVLAPATPPAD